MSIGIGAAAAGPVKLVRAERVSSCPLIRLMDSSMLSIFLFMQ